MFLLCNSATSAGPFHLKLLLLIQTHVQRAIFKRWSLVKQLNFFLQFIVRRIIFNVCTWNRLRIFAASADLLLPSDSDSYSFRCLHKPILNKKFISNFSQQVDHLLINLLIRLHLIASVNRGTSFSICNFINPSGRWKKMKRVWFKWEVRRIRPSFNLHSPCCSYVADTGCLRFYYWWFSLSSNRNLKAKLHTGCPTLREWATVHY